MGRLGAVLGRHRASWRPWTILGLSSGLPGALLGASWGPLGALLGPSWGPLRQFEGPLWPSWGPLGASWGPLGGRLGRLCFLFGGLLASPAVCNSTKGGYAEHVRFPMGNGRLLPLWWPLGALSERLLGLLDRLRATFGGLWRPWTILGLSAGLPGALLGASWGPCWSSLGAVWEPSQAV